MFFDKIAQRNPEFLLDIAGLVDMAGDAEDFRAGIFRLAQMGENQAAPRRMMVGTPAMVSTLLTVVGQPYRPIGAGKGGFMRGMPFLPSRLSSIADSSPQI